VLINEFEKISILFYIYSSSRMLLSSDNYQNNRYGKYNSGNELVDGVYSCKYKTQDGMIGYGFVL